jgi:hypothetical protein
MRWLPLVLLAGCASTSTGAARIVLPRAVDAASGAPRVERVRDLGEPVALPREGELSLGRSDGTLTVGEYALVEGRDFGKLPTVLVGGRPARVLARTAGGGIVTQIPTGVPGGTTSVEVSHPTGKHALQIVVSRQVVVARPGATGYVLTLGAEPKGDALGFTALGPLGVSPDGAWAYLAANDKATDRPAVMSIALAAPGGAAVHRMTRAEIQPRHLAVGGKRLVVLASDAVQLFDLDVPGAPAAYDPFVLPEEVVKAGPRAAALSPDARWLAVLAGDNHVYLFDLQTPESPRPAGAVDLLPGQRLPLARSLAFDGAGELWVVTGDTPASAAVGHQPSRLSRVDVEKATAALAVEIAGAGPPVGLAPSPREALKSATTIGDTDDDLPIFVSTIAQGLVPLDGKATSEVLTQAAQLAEPGQLVRTDRAGRGGPLPGLAGTLLGGLAVTPDAQLVVASGLRIEGGKARFGVWLVPLASGEPRFVDLDGAGEGGLSLPGSLGEVVVQP